MQINIKTGLCLVEVLNEAKQLHDMCMYTHEHELSDKVIFSFVMFRTFVMSIVKLTEE